MIELLLSWSMVLLATMWVGVHLATAGRLLLQKEQRWRGVAALLVWPWAPWWAWEHRWKRMSLAWVGTLLGYIILLVVARATL